MCPALSALAWSTSIHFRSHSFYLPLPQTPDVPVFTYREQRGAGLPRIAPSTEKTPQVRQQHHIRQNPGSAQLEEVNTIVSPTAPSCQTYANFVR